MERSSSVQVGIEFEYWKDGNMVETITDWCPTEKGSADQSEIDELANSWWKNILEAWHPYEIRFVGLVVRVKHIQYYDFSKWKPKT